MSTADRRIPYQGYPAGPRVPPAFAVSTSIPAGHRWLLHAGFALLFTLAWATAIAGPVQDFENAYRNAYGDYRAALFMTNSNDAAATTKALASLESKWSAIAARWGAAPPPQYADDPSWPEVMQKAKRILDEARAQVGQGKLTAAHETLEEFRDVFGELRARNNVVTYSDHMNAYHAKMEEVLSGNYSGFDAQGRMRLVRDAAVLEYLAGNLEKRAPRDVKVSPEFKTLLDALRASLVAVNKAVESGEAAAMQKSVGGLKPAYSKFFLRFG